MLGDSAYKLSTTIITPYRSNSSFGCEGDRNLFNCTLSKYRVRVENCIGLLKERFCSLKELKISIRNSKSKQFACRWILVSCIIHNLILRAEEKDDINDYFHLVDDENGDEIEENYEEENDIEAELKRKAILQIIQESL